jgi:flagellar basal-body rod protein FlgF
MSKGIYSATSGAVAMERALDVTAQNVANASTVGYRARRLSFSETLAGTIDAAAVKAEEPVIDSSPGAVQVTEQPLDVAIEGAGYLVVESDRGPLLTRAGNLHVRSDGVLADASGLPILGRDGPIELPPEATDVHIASDGTVSANGAAVGRLLVVNADDTTLVAEGDHLRPREGTDLAEADDPMLRTGALEKPNFDVVEGMVDLIRASRSYEALTRTIQTFSEIDARTARHGGTS